MHPCKDIGLEPSPSTDGLRQQVPLRGCSYRQTRSSSSPSGLTNRRENQSAATTNGATNPTNPASTPHPTYLLARTLTAAPQTNHPSQQTPPAPATLTFLSSTAHLCQINQPTLNLPLPHPPTTTPLPPSHRHTQSNNHLLNTLQTPRTSQDLGWPWTMARPTPGKSTQTPHLTPYRLPLPGPPSRPGPTPPPLHPPGHGCLRLTTSTLKHRLPSTTKHGVPIVPPAAG